MCPGFAGRRASCPARAPACLGARGRAAARGPARAGGGRPGGGAAPGSRGAGLRQLFGPPGDPSVVQGAASAAPAAHAADWRRAGASLRLVAA